MKWKERDTDYVCPRVAARYNKTNAVGKNVGNNLVNIDVLRVIRWIGLEPSIKAPGRDRKVTVYGFHSLRHSFASYCAEAGVPQATVVSILGADSDIVSKYYTHVGNEAQQQAIAAVSGGRHDHRPKQNKGSPDLVTHVLRIQRRGSGASQGYIGKINMKLPATGHDSTAAVRIRARSARTETCGPRLKCVPA